MTRTRLTASLVLALVTLMILSTPLLAGGEAVGKITSMGATLDGIRVPSGTTLLSPALVTTGEQAAIVHLRGGQVVNLGPETTAHVTALENGLVNLSVDEGSAAYLSARGELITLSSLGRAIFAAGATAAGQGQIQEGEENEVILCELKNPNPQKFAKCSVPAADGGDPGSGDCEWNKLVVDYEQVGDFLNVTSVLAIGEVWEGNEGNDIGLDKDCGTTPVAAFLVGGSIAGGVLGGAVLFDAIDADETISPVTP